MRSTIRVTSTVQIGITLYIHIGTNRHYSIRQRHHESLLANCRPPSCSGRSAYTHLCLPSAPMSPWAAAQSRLLVRKGLPHRPLTTCFNIRHNSNAATAPRKSWSDTLLLPKTGFPMKHKHPEKEELQWRERATSELYKWQVSLLLYAVLEP